MKGGWGFKRTRRKRRWKRRRRKRMRGRRKGILWSMMPYMLHILSHFTKVETEVQSHWWDYICTKSDCSWSWLWGPDPYPTACWKHKQVKGCDENLAQERYCGYCQSSPKLLLLWGLPLSASACSSLFPRTCQKERREKKKLPRASCRDKDYFPWQVPQERKLTEARAKDGVGKWQDRIHESLKHFGSPPQLSLPFSCSF